MPRGCSGSWSPAPAACTSAQGHQLCNGSWGAHPFPPQLSCSWQEAQSWCSDPQGAAQGHPTRVVCAHGWRAAGELSHILVPVTAAQTSRLQAALPFSTCAAHGPSLQHHIQILTTAVQETPASEESWEQVDAGLRGSPEQGPSTFLPVQAEAELPGDLRICTHQPSPNHEHPLAGARAALAATAGPNAGEHPSASSPGWQHQFAQRFHPHLCFLMVHLWGRWTEAQDPNT